MRMFSDCRGGCDDCLIFYTGGCIAGHGDNDFYRITKKRAKELMKKRNLEQYKIDMLKKKFPSLNHKNYLIYIISNIRINLKND